MKSTPAERTILLPFLKVVQRKTSFFMISLPAADIVALSYVARRGETEEAGAVQRLLNPARINGIRDFVLAGGVFPSSIVLNWVHETAPIISGNTLKLLRSPRCAQIIDGQHRVVGLSAAISKKRSLANLHLPVSLYTDLSTQECADIFLAINTEQKPVHRSLVFDLYKVASDYIVDPPAVRAGDLATELNENANSPYLNFIKFPGAAKGSKGLALSTVVSAVKPLVEEKGVFEQVGLTQLQVQAQFLINFFRCCAMHMVQNGSLTQMFFEWRLGLSAQ